MPSARSPSSQPVEAAPAHSGNITDPRPEISDTHARDHRYRQFRPDDGHTCEVARSPRRSIKTEATNASLDPGTIEGSGGARSLKDNAAAVCRGFRVPFYVLGLSFVLVIFACVAAMLSILDPWILDESTKSVETTTRGELVAVGERVSKPFRFIHTMIKMHALDTRASGDACNDGRTTMEQSRRYIVKQTASIHTSMLPLWVAYQMFRVPKPSGETWTYCGCATTGGHGYAPGHCDSFNQTHLLVTKQGFPVDLSEKAPAFGYNHTDAPYVKPILALREGIDEDGAWSAPYQYTLPTSSTGVGITVHFPLAFQYNWAFDVDASSGVPKSATTSTGGSSSMYHLYPLRSAPRPGLNASDPALQQRGQPFARQVTLTESADVLLEGIREFLEEIAPQHANVALVHVRSELLIATTFPIPLFDQGDGSHQSTPAIWPARRTPDKVLNSAVKSVFDSKLAKELQYARVRDESGTLPQGIPTPTVFLANDHIITAAVFAPSRGFLLCLITVTEKAPYYDSVLHVRLVAFAISGFTVVVCVVAVVVILVLINRSLSALHEATVAASTLQLDSAAVRTVGCISVLELAELQEAFGVMNDMLAVAGSYLPHGVRATMLMRQRTNVATLSSSGEKCRTAKENSQHISPHLDGESDQRESQLTVPDDGSSAADPPPQRGEVTGRRSTVSPREVAWSPHHRYVAVLQLNVVGFHSLIAASERHRTVTRLRPTGAVGRGAMDPIQSRNAELPPRSPKLSDRATAALGRFLQQLVCDESLSTTYEAKRQTASRSSTSARHPHTKTNASPRPPRTFEFTSEDSKALFLSEDGFEFLEHLTAMVVDAATRHGGVLDCFQGDRFTVSFNAVTGVQFPELRAFCCAALIRQKTQCCVTHRIINELDEGNHLVEPTRTRMPQKSTSASSRGRQPTVREEQRTTETKVVGVEKEVVGVPLSCGIAVGPAVVGSIGSTTVRRLGILGSVVGEAALLERLCKSYQGYPVQRSERKLGQDLGNVAYDHAQTKPPIAAAGQAAQAVALQSVLDGSPTSIGGNVDPPAAIRGFNVPSAVAAHHPLFDRSTRIESPHRPSVCDAADLQGRTSEVSIVVSDTTYHGASLEGSRVLSADRLLEQIQQQGQAAETLSSETQHNRESATERRTDVAASHTWQLEEPRPSHPTLELSVAENVSETVQPPNVELKSREEEEQLMYSPSVALLNTGVRLSTNSPLPSHQYVAEAPTPSPDATGASQGHQLWCAVSERAVGVLRRAGVDLFPVDLVSLTGGGESCLVCVVITDGITDGTCNDAAPMQQTEPAAEAGSGRPQRTRSEVVEGNANDQENSALPFSGRDGAARGSGQSQMRVLSVFAALEWSMAPVPLQPELPDSTAFPPSAYDDVQIHTGLRPCQDNPSQQNDPFDALCRTLRSVARSACAGASTPIDVDVVSSGNARTAATAVFKENCGRLQQSSSGSHRSLGDLWDPVPHAT